jgi:hypothetical protein
MKRSFPPDLQFDALKRAAEASFARRDGELKFAAAR